MQTTSSNFGNPQFSGPRFPKIGSASRRSTKASASTSTNKTQTIQSWQTSLSTAEKPPHQPLRQLSTKQKVQSNQDVFDRVFEEIDNGWKTK